MMANKLDEDLKALREWMKQIESKLHRPVFIHDTSEAHYRKKAKEYKELQKKIRHQTSKTHEVLNACDVFLNDTPDLCCNFDSLRTAHSNLQKRWEDICSRVKRRMEETEALRKDWDAFNADYAKIKRFVAEKAAQVGAVDVRSAKVNFVDLNSVEAELERIQEEQSEKLRDLDALNDSYCELARQCRLDTSDDLKGKFIRANHDWENLAGDVEALLRRIRHGRRLFENFTSLRERELAWMRRLEAQLAELETAENTSMEAREKRAALAKLRGEFQSRDSALAKVVEAGAKLAQRSELRGDADKVEDMGREFSEYQQDISNRLENLVDRLSPPAEIGSHEHTEGEMEGEEDGLGVLPLSVNTSSIQVRILSLFHNIFYGRSTQGVLGPL